MHNLGKVLSLVLVLIFITSLVTLQPATVKAASSDDWPMYQNDPGHSGYSQSTGPLGNQTIWKYTTDDTFWTAPTIANGIL